MTAVRVVNEPETITAGGAWVTYVDYKMPTDDCPGYIHYSHSPALQAYLDHKYFIMEWEARRYANLERIERLAALVASFR